MKDKRKAGGGAGRYVASFFKRVEELSDAQRHRARRLLTGSLGQVENHPKDRCEKQPRSSQFAYAPRKKCNRPAAERGRPGSPTQNDEPAYSSRLTSAGFFLVLAAAGRSRV